VRWHRTTSAILAEGVALPEAESHMRKAVVVRLVSVYVLHRMMYPQMHVNGVKKKKRGMCSLIGWKKTLSPKLLYT
jgi:hypothetical protein